MRYIDTDDRDRWISDKSGIPLAEVGLVMGILHELEVGVGVIDDPMHVFVYFEAAELAKKPQLILDIPDVTNMALAVVNLTEDEIDLILHLELHYLEVD